MPFLYFENAYRFVALFYVLLIGVPGPLLLAQNLDPDKAITQYVHDVWLKEDGLPHSTVHAILQTRDGYLWLGTAGGLVRFDGVHFDIFDKSTEDAFTRNRITALAETDDGTLWIGSEGGLLRYRGGTFTRFAGEAGLANENISDVVVDGEEHVWVTTTGSGVGRFDGERFTMYTEEDGLPHNTAWAGLRDAQGRIWVGTNNGVARFDGDEITSLRPAGEQVSRSAAFAEAFVLRADGTVWIGSRGGLGTYRDHLWQMVHFSNEQPMSVALQVLYEDRQGTLWGGGYEGLGRLVGERVEWITTEDGLSDNSVLSIYQDREGNLWVGTFNGLNRFRDGRFTNYSEQEGLPRPSVQAVRELRDGHLLISTGQALLHYREGRFELAQESHRDIINTIAEDQKGGLWLGGRCSGASRQYEGTLTWYGYEQGIAECVTVIEPSRDGGVWLGADSRSTGLYRIQEGQVTPGPQTGEWLVVNDIVETATGMLWIATWRGLGQRDPEGNYTFFTPDDGLADEVVATLYLEEEGTLWAGTDGGGLNRIQDGEITTISSRDGLCDDALSALVADEAGHLWMSGKRGISRILLADLHAVADGRATHLDCTLFDEDDGLVHARSTIGRPAAWRTGDGRLWFATPGGVAVVDPQDEHRNILPPPVVVKQMVVDNLPVDTSGPVVLPPGSQDFEFHYAGLSFVDPEAVVFRYRLEGRDDDWVEAGRRRTAYFTDLEPGTYTFRVIAANNDGVWNEQGATRAFVLEPYFWQTAWFYGLCALGLVALGAGGYGLRVRQLKQRERELTALVAERTESLRQEKEKTETLYLQLEADHARQKQELEEARALQLAMLPEHPPALDDLDIAVFMRTATEVGGDYYDFSRDSTGTLTVAVGDATGHGMKAGLVVATTKSYFQSLADKDSLGIVRQISRGLKEMKLRGMYMSLSLLKLRDGEATLVAAGMPPALLYRGDEGTVEPLVIKGMPLGSFPDFPYRQYAFTLHPGDLLLLLSDGLSELFNPDREMLGDAPIIERVRHTASGSAKQVIDGLMELAETWTDGHPQQDDITLVVIKRTQNT